MKGFVFFFFLLVIPSVGFSQNRVLIDSLKKRIDSSTFNKDQFELLAAIGWEYRFAKPDSTIFYCTNAYQLGKQLDIKIGLAKPLNFLAVAYNYLGNLPMAYDLGQQAIHVSTIQSDSNQLAYANNNIGRLLFEQGILSKSFPYFVTSLKIFTETNDPSGIAYVKQSLADLYQVQKDYDKAEQSLKEALSIRLRLNKVRDISSAYAQLGSYYQTVNKFEMATFYFLKSDSGYLTIDDAINLARLKILLADNYLKQGKITEARIIGEKGFDYITQVANIRRLPEAHLLMGKIYFTESKYDLAKRAFRSALEFSKASQQSSFQLESYYMLAQVSKRMDNKQDEISNMNQYLILKDSIEDLELARKVERLQFELQIENKEKENELLKLQQAKTEATVGYQKLGNILAAVVIASLSVLAIVTWQVSRRRKESNRKLEQQNLDIVRSQREIDKQNELLSEHNHSLLELNNEKDTLMSIVAHDLKSPLNRITGLVNLIELEGVLNGEQRDYVVKIKDATKAGSSLITDLLDVHEMEVSNNVLSIGKFDLSSLLKEGISLQQNAARAKGIFIEQNLPASVMVVSDWTYIHRILENLLSNAIKFSTPGTNVFVTLQIENSLAIISVMDKGPGFSEEDKLQMYKKFKRLSAKPTASESSNGLGLAIVKKLVDRLGGTIRLTTSLGAGSEFKIFIPFKKAET
jgi:signal transduction histidine kinase